MLCALLFQQSHQSLICAMIPGEIFTSFAEFQGIVSVNDFWFPLGFQKTVASFSGFPVKFLSTRIRLDPLSGQVLHHDCISMIVFHCEPCDLLLSSHQKIFSTRYGFAIASSAWGPCNFGPFTDLAISVFTEMSINTVLTQILTSLCSGL